MTDPAPWVQTASGLAVHLLSPRPEQITLADIAISLSRIPRFNGHTAGRVWSVAEHCLLVADLVSVTVPDAPPTLLLGALLHDAHEAYCGDRISPVKAAIATLRAAQQQLSQDPFTDITIRLDKAIHAAFALTLSDADRETIHHADMQALGIEAAHLMLPPPRPWIDLPEPPPGFIFARPQPPFFPVRRVFVARAKSYIERRHGVFLDWDAVNRTETHPRPSPDAADRPAPGDDSARHPGSGPAHEALPRATPSSGDTAC